MTGLKMVFHLFVYWSWCICFSLMNLIHDIFIVIFSVCHLDHQHTLLVLASCIAIGKLACCTALPLPSGLSSASEYKSAAVWKLDLVKKLFAIMSNGKLTTKVSEGNNNYTGKTIDCWFPAWCWDFILAVPVQNGADSNKPVSSLYSYAFDKQYFLHIG